MSEDDLDNVNGQAAAPFLLNGEEGKPVNEAKKGRLTKSLEAIKSKEFWLDRFPCSRWIPTYNLDCFSGDIIAGLTTALTVIPQGIGYAPLAGLPLQYGLYGSIVPGFVYCVFGTTKQATIGPTAVNSLMSFNYAGPSPAKAATLGLLAGIIEFTMGVLNLGFLLQFVSSPVISAFSSAVSIKVITSQIKGLFGLSYPGRGFLTIWIGLFSNIGSTRVPDILAGILSFVILYSLRIIPTLQILKGKPPLLLSLLRYVKISSNCLVLIIGSLVAYMYMEEELLIITGEVEGGLPPFQPPWDFPLSLNKQTENNSTIGQGGGMESDLSSDPLQIIQELGIGLIMLPMVSLLQHLAIAKNYAGSGVTKASQEMIALGLCQTLGSFTGSMSVTASFGRSAVNGMSGVKTPFGGVITGLIIILACAVLSPALAFIPTSVLSAVIIFGMFFTIAYMVPYNLAKNKSIDLVPYTVTFFLGLFWSVEMGLITGTLVHSLLVVYLSTRLHVEERIEDGCVIVKPDRNIFYPSVEKLRSDLLSAAERGRVVILDLSETNYISYDVVATINKQLKPTSRVVSKDQALRETLENLGSSLTIFSSVAEAKRAALEETTNNPIVSLC